MKSVTAACFVILGCLIHEANAQPAAKLPAVDFSAMTCEQFGRKPQPPIEVRFYSG
jgi:hypothetical protein